MMYIFYASVFHCLSFHKYFLVLAEPESWQVSL